tara:strand:- start:347 stop:1171 length:825 start_codon:yes stop_codon:yes gene_type:complete
MKSFTIRRTLSLVFTLLVAAAIILVWIIKTTTLTGSYISGWTLSGMIVYLSLYNLRKKLPSLPLGSSSLWMQFHIYCGLLTALVFAIHLQFNVPTGMFESILAINYLLVFFSGIFGLYITRTYPSRLSNLGDEVFFEYIPVLKRKLHDQIEILSLNCSSNSGQTEIPEFYRDNLRAFVVGRPAVLSHLLGNSSRRWRIVLQAVTDHRRYMNEDEQQIMNEIEKLLKRKYQLDAQYVMQGALKVWLFIHIPATYSLLIFMFFHSLLVHAWSGGLS